MYRENLKNPDSLDFLGFLHTYFYVIPIRIFTDIKYVFFSIGKTYKFLIHWIFQVFYIRIFTFVKYVFLPKKWLRKYVCNTYITYFPYVLLRIPKPKNMCHVIRIFKFLVQLQWNNCSIKLKSTWKVFLRTWRTTFLNSRGIQFI